MSLLLKSVREVDVQRWMLEVVPDFGCELGEWVSSNLGMMDAGDGGEGQGGRLQKSGGKSGGCSGILVH